MRWIFRIFGILLVAVAIVVAGMFLVPNEQVTRILESQIEAATGREVTFEGSVRPSFYPDIGLRTGPVRVANAAWSDGGPILEAEGLNVALDLRGLLGGDLLIGDITAIGPRLLLETNSDGEVNWDMFGGVSEEVPAPTGDAPARRISLEHLSLTGAAIRFVDRRSGENVAVSNLDVDVRAPDLDGPAVFDITYRRAGQPISLKGKIAETQGFLDGTATGVQATLSAAGSRVAFNGRAALDGSASGRVDADIARTAEFLAALGLPGADLPKGFGRSGKVSADLSYGSNNVVSLKGLDADLEGNRFRGDLTVAFAGTPRVTGQIAASALDLSAFGGTGGNSAQSGWSKERIDASALSAVDADLGLTTPAITFGDIRLTDVAAKVAVEKSRAVLTLARAAGYGGSLSGEFVANNRDGLSVRATAAASGVKMQALLSALMGYERLAGTGEARISVLGSGGSVDAIMRSLGGDGSLAIRQGEIFGLTLGKLFLNEGQQGGSTIFNDLTGTFTINKGVLRNDDLTAQLQKFGVKGAGRIDLGGQSIDYRVTPVLPKVEGVRDVVFPVTIKGPWADPRIGVDVESAIKSTFDAEIAAEKEKLRKQVEAEKARIEAEARKKVDEKLQQELGVNRQEGESVEDALRRKLEEEAARGLRNLLGR
ncbi:AsmA family protein [Pseudaestuariivita atlantica]|uniref:AsmA domain-containing protein n=1 Tax=Pseudaestuariivita atlantica TaxID=1317121 RepID=A0A0L1JTM0_9RHOB|nr:AsmA family protein [Pseudaestuariivita atlantica]KNG94763.1 hypothetical protein ATO11_05060 [Pseudaestuariivita atlantica]